MQVSKIIQFSNKYPPVHTADSSFSYIVGDGVIHATILLTYKNVFLVSKFHDSFYSIS